MKQDDAGRQEQARRVAQRLMKIPGVHLVGIGGREKAGQPTGELVLKVFVEQKRSPGNVASDHMIPREVEGILTDVVETGRFTPSAVAGKPPYAEKDAYLQGDFGRYRPIKGGTQLGAKGGPAMPGTLGFMARVPGDPKRIMAVTCSHVIFPNGAFVPNRKVGQQNPEESSTKCCDNKIGICVAGHYDTDVDAALVQVDGGQEWVAEIHEIGFIKGPHDISAAEATPLTYPVKKRGRTLRLTGGTVQSIAGTGTSSDPSQGLPPRSYTNAIVIKPNPAELSPIGWFSQEGDSGSAVVNDNNEVCGMVFARNPQGWGLAQPLSAIISKFTTDDSITIQVATATRLGQVQTVPKAAADETSGDAGPDIPPALRRLERDLNRTERGRQLITTWMQHSRELNRLVHHERRVAASWRQANGPELFRLFISLVDSPDQPVPREIRGIPADHVLDEFLREVDRYASPELRHDLHRHRPMLTTLPGQSYDELLKQLH